MNGPVGPMSLVMFIGLFVCLGPGKANTERITITEEWHVCNALLPVGLLYLIFAMVIHIISICRKPPIHLIHDIDGKPLVRNLHERERRDAVRIIQKSWVTHLAHAEQVKEEKEKEAKKNQKEKEEKEKDLEEASGAEDAAGTEHQKPKEEEEKEEEKEESATHVVETAAEADELEEDTADAAKAAEAAPNVGCGYNMFSDSHRQTIN